MRNENTCSNPTPSLSHLFDRKRSEPGHEVVKHLFFTELGLEEVRTMWDERFGREVYAITIADSPFLAQKAAQQQEHLRQLRQRYGRLPITEIPLFPQEIQGLERLRQVVAVLGPGLPVQHLLLLP